MIDFKNIATVATYERKTLFRSWFFRIFALVTLFVMFMVNMGLFGHSYANWAGRAVPANIPYANVLIVSVAQAIIAVFLSSDFLKRDKKLDTTEVIYARPISNGEYVVGKTAGIMSLFLALLLVVLLMALTFNLIIKDTPVVWEAYLLYPLLVTIPTLIFILGLSFFLMILLKNQAVTFIVLLGYIGLALFYFKDRLDGLLDYMAFNFPMVYSDFIGFGDTSSILVHRLCYLLLGLGFIFGTIRFLSRLPQTGKWNFINLFGFVFFLAAGMAVGYKYYDSHQDSYARGNRYLAMNNAYAHMPVPDVSSNDLKVVQKDHGLVISSSLRIRNTMGSTLDTLLFSLNPGFIVDSISDSNGPVKWERKEQLVLIMPEKGLSPWRGTSLRIDYHGVPDRAVAYLDITRKERSSLKNVNLMKFDKFAGIVDPEYVLLTSEMIWYPVAGVGFNRTDFLSSVPDFARFSIEVQPRPGLTALCPGLSEPGDSVFRFRPEQELNSLPLVIGPLEKHSIEIDGTEYSLYCKPDHDYYSAFFQHVGDTLADVIKSEKENYEYNELDLYYPFKRVSLVEVPIQFHAYERPYTQYVGYVQPEMIFIPEKGAFLNTMDFKRYKLSEERRNKERERTRTPKEIEVDLLTNFIRNTFFQHDVQYGGGFGGGGERLIRFNTKKSYSENPFTAFPFYYNLFTGINSEDYPMFNTMVEIYLKEGYEVSTRQSFEGGTTDNEKANLALKDRSLEEVFALNRKDLSKATVYQAGSFIITALKNKVGSSEFDNFLYYYLEDRAFSEISFTTFAGDFMRDFGVDIRPYMEFTRAATDLPEFLVSDPEYIQTRDDYGDVYVVRVNISNVGGSTGLVDLSMMIPGSGGFGGGGRNMEPEHRLFEVSAGTTKQIQMVFYDQPRIMTFNTLVSGNIPSTFSVFLRSAKERKLSDLVEYEKVVTNPVKKFVDGELVVDNEDPGFSYISVSRESKIKQYIDSKKEITENMNYIKINSGWAPGVWKPVAHSGMYGETIRSGLVCRSGDGQNVARWQAVMPGAGFYDIYVYIPVSAMYSRPSGGDHRGGPDRGKRRGPRFADNGTEYTYTVSSSEGSEQVQLLLSNPEDGWNRLGTFHFPADTATVEITNKVNNGFRVIADAVKWVERD